MNIKKLKVKELEELNEMIRKRELIEQGNKIFQDMQNRSTAQNVLKELFSENQMKVDREWLREELRKSWLEDILKDE
jgi:uncharacterized membrane protein YheB (UPF0754 family)